MLSGNGRHRRPRQAPALVVAAGVTGSAIAIPLLGATSASAAEATTWEKLAECESGGAWSANPGNGYYGGLQLSQEMWEQYGGLAYAPSADQASRSQQIAVAEQILDDQGTAAWPSCAPIAGLTQDGAAADVDPGAPVTPQPSDTSDPSGSTGSGDSKDSEEKEKKEGQKEGEKGSEDSKSPEDSGEADEPTGEPTGEPSDDASDTHGADDKSRDKNHDKSGGKEDKDSKEDKEGKGEKGDSKGDSGKSGQKDTTSPTPEDSTEPSDDADGSASGRHRGDRADESPSTGGDGDRPGRHASRGGDRTDEVADGTYTVRSGDNLSVIAHDLDVDGGWHELYSENKKTVGADPDLILPGQSLDLGEK